MKNPGLTCVAVLTLALAIGATSTIFSLLSQAILQTLPVRDPNQLVVLSSGGAHPGHCTPRAGTRTGTFMNSPIPCFATCATGTRC